MHVQAPMQRCCRPVPCVQLVHQQVNERQVRVLRVDRGGETALHVQLLRIIVHQT